MPPEQDNFIILLSVNDSLIWIMFSKQLLTYNSEWELILFAVLKQWPFSDKF